MALQAHLELKAGADRSYRAAVYSLWAVAALTVFSQLTTMPWPLIPAALVVLFVFNPGRCISEGKPVQVRLYANGAAMVGEQTGTWGRYSWTCRWISVLRIDDLPRPLFLLLCASRNHPDDYRHLLVWTRFPPDGEANLLNLAT